MKVAVIGTGYVGLVSGVCLASKGHEVICVDRDLNIVEKINQSKPTIYEEGLEEILKQVIKSRNFRATSNINEALENASIVMIAVGTPSQDGEIDLSQVKECAREIGSWIGNNSRYISVVVKSTVLPSTTDTVVKDEIEKTSGKKFGAFGLGMNPEFLREGEAIGDFNYPDRIVLGYEDEKTRENMMDLYAPWSVEKIFVSTRTAEMIKYSNNSILATQISMVNELANLAARIGNIDFLEVMSGVFTDKRWNPILENGERANPPILSYLIPGCGFGGSCFPKDVQAIRSMGESYGLLMSILNAVLDVNDSQPNQVVKIIKSKVNSLERKKVLVLGLAFKPGTDDVRESASFKIVKDLAAEGAEVFASDPIAIENFKQGYPDCKNVNYFENWKDFINKMDIVVISTKWSEYLEVPKLIPDEMLIFDARRLLNKSEVKNYLTI